jgi:subtilisin family serine protease/PKD repeat protein
VLAACGADPAAPPPAPAEVTVAPDSTPTPPPPAAADSAAPAREVGVFLHDGEESVAAVARDLLRRHAPNAGARADSVRALETLRLFTVPLTEQEAARLLADPRVADAGELPPVELAAAPTTSWAVDRVDQRALPLDTDFAPAATGEGVRIYILDTGVRATHDEYAARLLPGYDATLATAASGVDCNGHGTFVASNAAGTRYGVASDANVVDVKVMGCSGSGSMAHIFAGMDWVLQQKLADPSVPTVANLSLGSTASSAFDAVVARLTAGGVVVVAAAGNSNADACTKSPARAPTAITVGATASDDARASFSNWGRCVDVFAPGQSIPGASAGSDAGAAFMSGTSMAAPIAAGIAAAYLEQYPTATPEQVHEAVIAASTRDRVTNPGAGSPNRLAFVGSLGALPTAGALTAEAATACVRRSCTFDGAVSRGGVTGYAWELGDSVRATTSRAVRTFPRDGAFPVRLTVRDAGGRTSSWVDTVDVVDRAPTAGTISATCTPTRVCTLTSAGAGDDGRVARYAWTFGDGGTLATSATTVRRTYGGYGSFTVRLTVTDDVGQTATTSRTVTVTPPLPTVGFRVTCSSGRTCTFDASSSRALDGIASYRWEFGNTRTGTGVRATHQYSAAGSYPVRLTVTSTTGLSAQRTLSLVMR